MAEDEEGASCRRPSGHKALLGILRAIAQLQDAEQYLLAAVMQGDWRELEAFVANSGWLRDLHDRGWISIDLRNAFERIGEVVLSAALLPADQRDALASWFEVGSRTDLHRLGVSDAMIGLPRIVSDDIWPQEREYLDVSDGTLVFGESRDGRPTPRFQFGADSFDYHELNELLKLLSKSDPSGA
jgi:hypothetical protein